MSGSKSSSLVVSLRLNADSLFRQPRTARYIIYPEPEVPEKPARQTLYNHLNPANKPENAVVPHSIFILSYLL